jgi:hypothetical protein
MELNPRIRRILVAAQLEHGLSAAETARAAQAGELEGLPPTRVSETTCRDLAAEARRERSTQSNGTATSESEEARELGDAMAAEADERAFLERQIARIKAIEQPTAKDLHALRTAMNALGDIDRREAKRAPQRPVERQTGCRHITDGRDDREPCTCSKPCFAAWLCADYAKARRLEAEGRPVPCKGFAISGGDTCYQCGEPLANHERLHYDGQEWSEPHQRAYPQLAQV